MRLPGARYVEQRRPARRSGCRRSLVDSGRSKRPAVLGIRGFHPQRLFSRLFLSVTFRSDAPQGPTTIEQRRSPPACRTAPAVAPARASPERRRRSSFALTAEAALPSASGQLLCRHGGSEPKDCPLLSSGRSPSRRRRSLLLLESQSESGNFREIAFSEVNSRCGYRERAPAGITGPGIRFREHDRAL